MKKLPFLLSTISASMVLLTACNSGTTNNYYTSGCSLPTFTPEVGIALIESWGQSLQTYSASNYPGGDTYVSAGYFTMSNYLPGATLLPTFSSEYKSGTQEIYGYFTHFLQLNPIMTIPESSEASYASIGCGMGGANGYYDFLTTDPTTQQESIIHARFSFLFEYIATSTSEEVIVESGPETGTELMQINPPGWYVLSQHSSAVPQ